MSVTQVDAVALLRELEWSGSRKGQGSYMGAADGRRYPACPVCGQIKPDSGSDGDFTKDAVGHAKDCRLRRAVE